MRGECGKRKERKIREAACVARGEIKG